MDSRDASSESGQCSAVDAPANGASPAAKSALTLYAPWAAKSAGLGFWPPPDHVGAYAPDPLARMPTPVAPPLRPRGAPAWPEIGTHSAIKRECPAHDDGPASKQTIRYDEQGKKLYACTICNFGTKQKGLLKVHINSIHYKMKTYQCDLCKFISIQKGNLRAHILTVHEKARNFPCDLCEYRAGTKGILKTHIKNRHLKLDALKHGPSRGFECDLCPYKALRQSHLKQHTTMDHGGS